MAEDLSRLTNLQLIRRCAKQPRDERAWNVFYDRFGQHIKLMVLREARNKNFHLSEETLKDLVNEVYFRLVQKNCKALIEFRSEYENAIFTFLDVVARHEVRNHIKKEKGTKKRPKNGKSLDEPLDHSDNEEITLGSTLASDEKADQIITDYSIYQELDSMLDRLLKGKHKDRDKLIFKLAFIKGFTAEEIASKPDMGVSLKTIRNRISDIKQSIPEKELKGVLQIS